MQDERVQGVVAEASGDVRLDLASNNPEIPDSCLPVELPVAVAEVRVAAECWPAHDPTVEGGKCKGVELM